MTRGALLALGLFSLTCAQASARGVSPYLPLNLEPEFERQIERVLVLADKPVMTRPIAAATVLDALPAACPIDPVLCEQVRRTLARYMRNFGISHASVEAGAADEARKSVPNRYGMSAASEWQVTASAYWQPSDYLLLQLGGVADADHSEPTGSVVSVGFDRAQLDIGYRGHWLSPMTDSSFLVGTEAPTMPSVTISNYVPLTRFGFHYEAFVSQMSRSEAIAFGSSTTTGHPKLAGLHASVEPATGWSLAVNRLMQYGGGARGNQSFGDLLQAFFRPSRYDNTNPELDFDEQFGNQLASITSRFLFPGRTPFAVYFEYAGEDTSRGRDYLLGNAALSAGVHFPRIWRRFDLTYESSEWQNGWYVNGVYGDGLTNEAHVVGHWGADERVFNDDVGGRSHMLRLGWEPGFGGLVELRYRALRNEDYSSTDYEHAHDVTVRYSRSWREFTVGAEVFTGRDVFGNDFSRIAAFVRYLQDAHEPRASIDSGFTTPADPTAQLFVEAGASLGEVIVDRADSIPRTTSDAKIAPHIGIGARRAVSERSDLGARVELDQVDDRTLIGVRAIDYRYRFRGHLAFSFFVGAARYDVETPAYGMYYGIGGQWRGMLPGWDAGLDVKYATKVARDHVLPDDPLGDRTDSFYDISAVTLYISRRF